MRQIDWYLVATASCWILGCAVVLAAFGYHQWMARVRGRRLADQLREPAWGLSAGAGALLIGLGFGLAPGARWWQRLPWLVLAALSIATLLKCRRSARRRRQHQGSQ